MSNAVVLMIAQKACDVWFVVQNTIIYDCYIYDIRIIIHMNIYKKSIFYD